MINFTRLYTMDRSELSDIIFTLEMCRIDALKTGKELEEIYDKVGTPKNERKNASYMRACDLEKIISILGGKQYGSFTQE